MCGFMLILTLFLREYSLERKTVQSAEPRTLGDVERGVEGHRNPLDDPDLSPTNTVTCPEESDAHKLEGSRDLI